MGEEELGGRVGDKVFMLAMVRNWNWRRSCVRRAHSRRNSESRGGGAKIEFVQATCPLVLAVEVRLVYVIDLL